MTNSKPVRPSAVTGQLETTSPAADSAFVSNKGTPYTIETANNGLFFIKMRSGGIAPKFTEEFFTSHREAQKVLEMYLRTTDRIGNAKYPSKGK